MPQLSPILLPSLATGPMTHRRTSRNQAEPAITAEKGMIMDWQTSLIAEVAGCFAAYLAVGCAIGLLCRRFDRD